jgi:hypothetical protein
MKTDDDFTREKQSTHKKELHTNAQLRRMGYCVPKAMCPMGRDRTVERWRPECGGARIQDHIIISIIRYSSGVLDDKAARIAMSCTAASRQLSIVSDPAACVTVVLNLTLPPELPGGGETRPSLTITTIMLRMCLGASKLGVLDIIRPNER